VIAYYSGWLFRPPSTPNLSVGDDDMSAFMSAVQHLNRDKGLDLILHTPGGNIGATEALVKYLWDMFDKDIRVIVPQLAMSAGTMIACAAKEIVLGKHSSLGPIDPQMGGVPAQGVLDEFQMAVESIKRDPASTPLWQRIVSRYHPSFLIECAQSIDWSRTMVHGWLCENMFKAQAEREVTARKIVDFLGDHSATAAHDRHIPMSKCEEIGLKIIKLEDDEKLQDLVLTVHHAYMHTFSMSPACKIVENHTGVATVQMLGVSQMIRAIPGQAGFPGIPLQMQMPVGVQPLAHVPAGPAVEKPEARPNS
jgi:Serine dehydrogenase proteinase